MFYFMDRSTGIPEGEGVGDGSVAAMLQNLL